MWTLKQSVGSMQSMSMPGLPVLKSHSFLVNYQMAV